MGGARIALTCGRISHRSGAFSLTAGGVVVVVGGGDGRSSATVTLLPHHQCNAGWPGRESVHCLSCLQAQTEGSTQCKTE